VYMFRRREVLAFNRDSGIIPAPPVKAIGKCCPHRPKLVHI
jgi:hypothetical protein